MGQLEEDIAERLVRAGVLLISGPQAVDVELDPLGQRAAEQHGAEGAVPDRQRLGHPRAGGLGIPEHGGRGRRGLDRG